MSQPASTLPDIDAPVSSTPARPEDYLSDLASKEIDRLLVDSDLKSAPHPEAHAGSTSTLLDIGPLATVDPLIVLPEDSSTQSTEVPATGALALGSDSPAVSDSGSQPSHAAGSSIPPDGMDAATKVAQEPESHPAIQSSPASLMDATIAKELDQVFEQQVKSPTEGSTSVTTQGSPESPETSIAPTPTETITSEANTDASKATPPTAEVVSPDGVSDLLGRLSAGERAEPPAADSAAHADASHADQPPTAATESAAPHGAPAAHPANDHIGAVSATDGHSTSGDAHSAAEHSEPAALSVTLAPAAAGSSLFERCLDAASNILDPFDDEVRDAVGKVAIMTAVNALAILIYVLFFRG